MNWCRTIFLQRCYVRLRSITLIGSKSIFRKYFIIFYPALQEGKHRWNGENGRFYADIFGNSPIPQGKLVIFSPLENQLPGTDDAVFLCPSGSLGVNLSRICRKRRRSRPFGSRGDDHGRNTICHSGSRNEEDSCRSRRRRNRCRPIPGFEFSYDRIFPMSNP